MQAIKFIAISASLILSSAFTFASPHDVAQDHNKHHPATTAQQQPAKDVSSAASNTMPATGDIEEDLKKMNAVMEKIHQEKSPDARRMLMQEHMTMMQEGMKCMGNMPMASGGMDDMQQHMKVMHQMMDQMMQHMAAQEKK